MYKNFINISNKISLKILQFIIIIFIIQIDILENFNLLDLPYFMKYGSNRYMFSAIYSVLNYYGSSISFIIYTILFKIIIFMAMGLLLPCLRRKENQKYLIIIFVALYNVFKCILKINVISMDIILIEILAIYLGYRIKCTNYYIKSIYNKNIIAFTIVLILIAIMPFKMIYSSFFVDLNSSNVSYFVDENNLKSTEVSNEWGNLYKPYIEFNENLKKNRYTVYKGEFKGIKLSGNSVKIKIGRNIKTFKYKEFNIIDKMCLDSDNKKIFVHPRLNDIFIESLSDSKKYRLEERIAQLVYSNSKIIIISDDDRIISACIYSDLCKGGFRIF